MSFVSSLLSCRCFLSSSSLYSFINSQPSFVYASPYFCLFPCFFFKFIHCLLYTENLSLLIYPFFFSVFPTKLISSRRFLIYLLPLTTSSSFLIHSLLFLSSRFSPFFHSSCFIQRLLPF